MKSLFLKIFIIILISSSLAYPSSETLKIGIYYEKLFTTKKEANIGMKLWVKQMDESEYKIKMEAILYEDEQKLINDFKNSKIHVLVGNASFYYENKKIINDLSDVKWIMSSTDDLFEEYYLVKNKNSNADINNLNTKKIYYNNSMAKNWIESYLYKHHKKVNQNMFYKLEKSKKLIFNIFFNTDNVSIVSKDLYTSMASFNPQINDKLEILEKSKKIFFNGIGFTRKNLKEEFRNTLDIMTQDMKNKISTFDIISFVSIQKIFVLKDGDLDEVDKFYDEYIKLKRTYK